jgi:hypothetical protein
MNADVPADEGVNEIGAPCGHTGDSYRGSSLAQMERAVLNAVLVKPGRIQPQREAEISPP